jgi:hypothetical protein
VENIEKFPMFSGMFRIYEAVFPGLIHKCPYVGVSGFIKLSHSKDFLVP